ncbi:hypothetical protein CRYUN_Cryun31cG0063900 [Craigia yunnanensis]
MMTPMTTAYICLILRQQFSQDNGYYSPVDFDEMSNHGSHKFHPDRENIDSKSLSCSPMNHIFPSPDSEGITQLVKKGEHEVGDECETSSSLYAAEPVDFENNGLLWLPPEPEVEEDEREAALFDDDDGDATGDWGYLRNSSSFGSGESRIRDRSSEEHKKVKNIVDEHFRTLVAQLLQVESLPVGDENDKDIWLEIISALSWEAATLLKPDTSKGGGMDPGGYVKVKCIASGRPCESMVVKGVVCKKNVAHRRMTSKIEKPQLLILGGALEYQRVSNLLSSFDTLLQQEMDHLKMAVAKIHAHQPNTLLVEKSVSRFAYDYLLEKDISLVLNMKRPLLERIARCTAAQIIPSIDHLSSQKLGYCEKFHVERFMEDLGSAGQGGKKLVKTLMYSGGCPKPLGCTKVKHVVQYGMFAAYLLALETSFLADEGASLPEFPLNSSITVALLNKPSSIVRSISTVPGFTIPDTKMSQEPQHSSKPRRANSIPTLNLSSSIISHNFQKIEENPPSCLPNGTSLLSKRSTSVESIALLPSTTEEVISDAFSKKNEMGSKESSIMEVFVEKIVEIQPGGSEASYVQQDSEKYNNHSEEPKPLKEEFPPSPSDNQSILVSLSSRCVWKGTVCERSHLFRIKYYGNLINLWATQRIVMSDAAWGLSFGKFLELSFSNHAAASRVASWAILYIEIVFVSMVDFDYENQEWIRKETDKVVDRAELLFSEVFNSLCQIAEKIIGSWAPNSIMKTPQLRHQIAEPEGILQKEKLEFEVHHDNPLNLSRHEEKSLTDMEKLKDMDMLELGKGSECCDSALVDAKLDRGSDQRELNGDTNQSDAIHQEPDISENSNLGIKDYGYLSSSQSMYDRPDYIAAVAAVMEGLDLEDHSEEKIGPKVLPSLSPALSTRGSENMEDSVSWLRMPFLSFYHSLNKNFLGSASKLDTFIYDDEPTSMISYALASPEYHFQLSDDGDRRKDNGDLTASVSDSMNFQLFLSVDEMTFDPHRSLCSTDEVTGSRSSLIMNPLSCTKDLHVRVSFGDDGSFDKVKYTVTCYYAKRFEALRRICCPSELDFIRSLSRCKK